MKYNVGDTVIRTSTQFNDDYHYFGKVFTIDSIKADGSLVEVGGGGSHCPESVTLYVDDHEEIEI
tara:strand:+ start:4451 stop:4645 length:195 start_codon:yes stop_codon:yes gene_type:complete